MGFRGESVLSICRPRQLEGRIFCITDEEDVAPMLMPSSSRLPHPNLHHFSEEKEKMDERRIHSFSYSVKISFDIFVNTHHFIKIMDNILLIMQFLYSRRQVCVCVCVIFFQSLLLKYSK